MANLREYFHDALHGALERQHLAVEDQTEHYVVNLLTLFARSDALYEQQPGSSDRGTRLKPLVVMLTEALEAPTPGDRHRGLQRLGDVSLFIAGFFSQSFARKLIDIDYHIAMGGRAYSALADALARTRSRVLGQVFAELAEKFQPMVDALNDISETLLSALGQGHPAAVRGVAEDGQQALVRHPEAARRRSHALGAHGVRSLTMILRQLQQLIGGIYDVSVTHDVYDFLVTNREQLPEPRATASATRS